MPRPYLIDLTKRIIYRALPLLPGSAVKLTDPVQHPLVGRVRWSLLGGY
jgi:hypothetical protein